MKCNECGAESSVIETRAFMVVMLRRVRLCFNEHKFQTFEVYAGNLNRPSLSRPFRGITKRNAAARLRRQVAASSEPAPALAARLKISESRVRQIRNEIKRATIQAREEAIED